MVSSIPDQQITILHTARQFQHLNMERQSGFEPELQPWQGRVLTVKHHSRIFLYILEEDCRIELQPQSDQSVFETVTDPVCLIFHDYSETHCLSSHTRLSLNALLVPQCVLE